MEKETGENRTDRDRCPAGRQDKFELDDAEEMVPDPGMRLSGRKFYTGAGGGRGIHPNLSRATEILLPIGKLAGKEKNENHLCGRTRRYPQGTGRET